MGKFEDFVIRFLGRAPQGKTSKIPDVPTEDLSLYDDSNILGNFYIEIKIPDNFKANIETIFEDYTDMELKESEIDGEILTLHAFNKTQVPLSEMSNLCDELIDFFCQNNIDDGMAEIKSSTSIYYEEQ